MSYAEELVELLNDGFCIGISRELVIKAMEEREELVPELIRILRELNEYIDEIDCNTYNSHIFALFILAHFKEYSANEEIYKLLTQDPVKVDYLLDDIVTSEIQGVLATMFRNDIDSIKGLIEDTSVLIWVRIMAISALTILWDDGVLTEEHLKDYYKQLLLTGKNNDDVLFITAVVRESVFLVPVELSPIIESYYDEGLIDEFIIPHEDYKESLQMKKGEALSKIKREYCYFTDAVERLEYWNMFDIAEEPDSEEEDYDDIEFDDDYYLGVRKPVKVEPKIGRNDPCPCGSGKKYKKCCGQ